MTEVRLARDLDRAAWEAFVAGRTEADPLQSWAWGDANAVAREMPVRLIASDGDTVRGVAQLLVRAAGFGRSVAYAPHGPVWDRDSPDAGTVLSALIEGMRVEAARRRVIVLKVDPRTGTHDTPEDLQRALLASGFRVARHDLQARTTRIVGLLDGADELIKTWDKDARNLVRRAAKEGVETSVDRTGDPAEIQAFHELLEATSERAGFRTRSAAFLATLASGLALSGGWFLTIARLKGRPIAGAVALRVGDRAIYAYGASLREPELKHANGPYASLAATMRALADDGVRTLDLWGVVEPDDTDADQSWAGFSAFKRQFGGTPLRHPGTYDLVISPLWNTIRDLRERIRP